MTIQFILRYKNQDDNKIGLSITPGLFIVSNKSAINVLNGDRKNDGNEKGFNFNNYPYNFVKGRQIGLRTLSQEPEVQTALICVNDYHASTFCLHNRSVWTKSAKEKYLCHLSRKMKKRLNFKKFTQNFR